MWFGSFFAPKFYALCDANFFVLFKEGVHDSFENVVGIGLALAKSRMESQFLLFAPGFRKRAVGKNVDAKNIFGDMFSWNACSRQPCLIAKGPVPIRGVSFLPLIGTGHARLPLWFTGDREARFERH